MNIWRQYSTYFVHCVRIHQPQQAGAFARDVKTFATDIMVQQNYGGLGDDGWKNKFRMSGLWASIWAKRPT